MPQTGGTQRAIEVHIFPEAIRGAGGHRPWDLRPQSTMTNANVEQAASAVDGQTLTLKYKDGEKRIVVHTDAPVVPFAPGDKAELKLGVKVFIAAASKQSDGSLLTERINCSASIAISIPFYSGCHMRFTAGWRYRAANRSDVSAAQRRCGRTRNR
jgi:hypothetical protein